MALQLLKNKISTIFLTVFLSISSLIAQGQAVAQVKAHDNNKSDVTDKANSNEDIYENLNLFVKANH